MLSFREAAKKVLFFLVAGPLKGGGTKGLATKKKDFHWQSRCFLTSLLQYLAKIMALLVQKFCGEYFLSEFIPGYFKTKKKARGGWGKALVAGPLKKDFFAASLINTTI